MLGLTLLSLVCNLALLCAESVSVKNDIERCRPPPIPHGRLERFVLSLGAGHEPDYAGSLSCHEGYRLDGPAFVTCDGQGRWRSHGAFADPHRLPQCKELTCPEPDPLDSGRWEVEGPQTAGGSRFRHGAVASYRCDDGLELRTAGDGAGARGVRRVCSEGRWRGELPVCARPGCGPPPAASRGFFLEVLADGVDTLPRRDQYPAGARALYRCNPGHVMVGTESYQCMGGGQWSPSEPPLCRQERSDQPLPVPACELPERQPMTTVRLVKGWLSDAGASEQAVVEYQCTEGTRDRHAPCQPRRVTCYGGRWIGRRPHCLPVATCARPPAVAHGDAYGGDSRAPGAEVFYTCRPGYRLLGPSRLSCDSGGCWSPARLAPVCQRQPAVRAGEAGPAPLLSPVGVTLLAVTVAVVLLLVVLLALLLQRRAWKPLRRPPPTPPPPAPRRQEEADRVALIAYQEGSQFVLPTYEEAVRAERALPALPEPGVSGAAAQLAARLHHPHHRSLPRRERLWRREPESDSVSQRSVQSHQSVSRHSNATSNATPSLLDSLGSTETMATSEAASTTLSAAANASVRAMCGSVASFDTSSVLNTEGVPLLEENETELEGAQQDDSLSCGKSSAGDTTSNK